MDVGKRIGVMGGSFDPIHIAHLIAGEEARTRLELSQVLYVPAGDPWHRGGRVVAETRHRVAMVELAIASNPYFHLSEVDIGRVGPTYSVDTITSLRDRLGPNVQFYFILGTDSVIDLPTWKEPDRLIRMCQLVAVPRPGFETFDISALESRLPGIAAKVQVLSMPLIGISATEIRQRVRDGLSIKYQVPEPVESYIRTHGLYKR